MTLYKYILVTWIVVFSSAYKLFADSWCLCVLISSDATTHFKFINRTRDRTCGHADTHVRSHARLCETEQQNMNNIVHSWSVINWLFQLHRSAKPSFRVGAIKVWKLVTWEGPTANVFQRITLEFCNRETFPPWTICNIRYLNQSQVLTFACASYMTWLNRSTLQLKPYFDCMA